MFRTKVTTTQNTLFFTLRILKTWCCQCCCNMYHTKYLGYGWLGPLQINTNKNELHRRAINQGSLQKYKKWAINPGTVSICFFPRPDFSVDAVCAYPSVSLKAQTQHYHKTAGSYLIQLYCLPTEVFHNS